MYAKEDIVAQLRKLGVPQDKPVTIHTSLKKIGEVVGRGEGLLNILIEYITEKGGLLCVPTHTPGRLYKDDIITLDFLEPYTHLGVLPMLAARDSRGIRSINPSHSMTVFGEKEAAQRFADADRHIRSCTSPEGCYGRLYDEDGYVLLMGVTHNQNTYLHCVEEMLGLPDRLTAADTDTTIRYLDGRIEHFPLKTYWPTPAVGDVSLRFSRYEPAFREHGCIVDGKIGDADAQLCSARGMAEVARLIYLRSGKLDVLGTNSEIKEAYYAKT